MSSVRRRYAYGQRPARRLGHPAKARTLGAAPVRRRICDRYLFCRLLFLRRRLRFRFFGSRRRRLGGGGGWRPRAGPPAGLGDPGVQELDRLRQRDLIGRDVARQRRVDAGMAHIGAIAAVLGHDRATLRVVADRASGVGAEAPLARTFGDLLGDQRDGAVETDGEDLIDILDIGVGLAVQHIGTEAADARLDGLAVFRLQPDLARQRQQLERQLEIDRGGLGALGQSGALGLLAVLDRLAELDIGPEAARPQRDLEAALRILAEFLDRLDGALGRGRERTRVAAFRIVRAADEGAELAELEGKPAGAAG